MALMSMLMRKQGRGAMRLLSAVVALALVVAHAIGGYAHAAGHNHSKEPAACVFQASSEMAAAAEMSGQADSEHCNVPANPGDALDFMCNGGVAVLMMPSFVCPDQNQPHASTVAGGTPLLLPGSLDRPPRSTVRA
jgi:hypothetical protein